MQGLPRLFNLIRNVLRENKGFLLFVSLMIVMRSSFADWYHVPSGSMEPTIQVGDRVMVNKMAYNVELPLTDYSLIKTGKPARGDIVVIDSEAADTRLLKRIVATEGDLVSMHNNHLTINGETATYLQQDEQLFESVGGVSHQVQLTPAEFTPDSFRPVKVPAGHVLVLGDNRNHSADSRVYGFVPVSELRGKVFGLVTSFDPDNYYLPRKKRTFIKVS